MFDLEVDVDVDVDVAVGVYLLAPSLTLRLTPSLNFDVHVFVTFVLIYVFPTLPLSSSLPLSWTLPLSSSLPLTTVAVADSRFVPLFAMARGHLRKRPPCFVAVSTFRGGFFRGVQPPWKG